MKSRIFVALLLAWLGGCATFSGRSTFELAATPVPESILVYVEGQEGWIELSRAAWRLQSPRTIAIAPDAPGSERVRIAYDVRRTVASGEAALQVH